MIFDLLVSVFHHLWRIENHLETHFFEVNLSVPWKLRVNVVFGALMHSFLGTRKFLQYVTVTDLILVIC